MGKLQTKNTFDEDIPVTTSAAQAESYAAMDCVKSVMAIRHWMAFMGFKQQGPTVIYIDSQSALMRALRESPDFERNRHYDISIYYINQLVRQEVIEFKHIAGLKNPADMLTKIKGIDK